MANQTLVAPAWRNLPSDVQQDFRGAKFDQWYQDPRNNDANRLTLINCYWKMKQTGLWGFVHGPAEPNPQRADAGHLEFTTRNPAALQSYLSSRSDFSSPTWSLSFWNTKWDSREKVQHGQLHLKSFPGWPANRIQAHVDPAGFVWSDPTTLASHLSGSQQDVLRINRLLRALGHGPWFTAATQTPAPTPTPRPVRTFTEQTVVGRPYKVAYGDRVWNLAGNFGYRDPREFVRDFKTFNPGVDPHRIYAGTTYTMPFRGQGMPFRGQTGAGTLRSYAAGLGASLTATSYRVNRGDTLWNLASDFGYRDRRRFVTDFKTLNPGVNPNRIYTGTTYTMPFRGQPPAQSTSFLRQLARGL